MTFVVTQNCHRCRYTDCVPVCPVDCFHGDAEMLYIDPALCIDCGASVPGCPVEAIYEEGMRVRHLPIVSQKTGPLPGAGALARELVPIARVVSATS